MVSAKHAFIEMGKVGERPLQAGGYKMAKDEVQRKARLIPALETGASVMQEHYICDCKKQEEPCEGRLSSTVVRPDKVDISNGCKSHQSKSQRSVAK